MVVFLVRAHQHSKKWRRPLMYLVRVKKIKKVCYRFNVFNITVCRALWPSIGSNVGSKGIWTEVVRWTSWRCMIDMGVNSCVLAVHLWPDHQRHVLKWSVNRALVTPLMSSSGKERTAFFGKIGWYLDLFMIPSILNRTSVLIEKKQSHSIVLYGIQWVISCLLCDQKLYLVLIRP